jgi:acyl-CoA-dependent ceramide synthase
MPGLSINVLMLLVLTHVCFPSLRSSTIQYFTLSYYDAQTGLYNPGWQDLKFVSLCIIVFTALRAAAMDYALVPMARKCGIHKKKATIRFAEQAWLVLYYATFWSLGTVRIHKPTILCTTIANTKNSISYTNPNTSITCPQCGQLSPHAP